MEPYTSYEDGDKNKYEHLSLRIIGFSPNKTLYKQYQCFEAKVVLLDSDRKPIFTSQFSEKFEFGKRLKYEKLFRNIEPLISLFGAKDDKSKKSFEFVCEIWLIENSKKHSLEQKSDKSFETSDKPLVLSADTFCDFSIECKDGTIIYVHKHIFFKSSAVLQKNMQLESYVRATTMKFQNTNSKAVSEAVRFIYTEMLIYIDGIEKDLIEFANELEINGLADACMQKLRDGLTVDTVVNRLVLSYNNNFDSLQKHFIKFILAKLKEVRQHETWKQLTKYPDLLMEILDQVNVP